MKTYEPSLNNYRKIIPTEESFKKACLNMPTIESNFIEGAINEKTKVIEAAIKKFVPDFSVENIHNFKDLQLTKTLEGSTDTQTYYLIYRGVKERLVTFYSRKVGPVFEGNNIVMKFEEFYY